MRNGYLPALIAVLLTLAACTVPVALPEMTVPTVAPTGAPSPTATPAPPPAVLCAQCGEHFLLLHDGEVTQLDLPQVRSGAFYDYTQTTGRILYGSQFPDQGGGPGSLAVTDLYVWDLADNEATEVIAEEVVVRALWAPDGEHFVYLRATDETYELRWRGPDGEDRLLVTDAALTFSVSPTGDKVAFTRESNYGLDITPGVYIVDVASGDERQVASLDKAGTGSIDDRPVWSPDERVLLLNLQRSEDLLGLYRIFSDGTGAAPIGFDPTLVGEIWYEAQPFQPLWLDGTHILGTPFVHTENAALDGEPLVVRYELNEALDTIIAGELISEGTLLGWNVPGESVWVMTAEGAQAVPLP